MSVEFDWAGAIALGQSASIPDAVAETWIREVPTGSRPQIWECDDGNTYYVKHPNNPQDRADDVAVGARVLVAERVFGLLAEQMGAPCGIARLIDVPQSLVDAGQLVYQDGTGIALAAGLAHGSVEIPEVEQGAPPSEAIPENKRRYACLAVLHAWFVPGDIQWLRGVRPPHLVWSVDHAFYLAGANVWTIAQLQQNPYPVRSTPFPGAGLNDHDLEEALRPIADLTERKIADVVGSVPATWRVPLDDLIELGRWLWSRFERLRSEWG